MRQYRAAHPEKFTETKEKKAERAHQYYLAHREECLARSHAYHETHREAQLAKHREWNTKTRDWCLANRSPVAADSLTDIEAAYIAGLIDGEGTITISGPEDTPPMLRVSINMTNQAVLEWLAGKLSTSCYANPRQPRRNWSPQFKVQITAWAAVRLCARLLPFLIVKKTHAEIAIEFGDTIGYYYSRKKIPPEIVQKRLALKDRIRPLNQRGCVHALPLHIDQ
jgi:hypothetical protein